MSISLYDAVIPSYLQQLAALEGVIGKAEAHCAAQGVTPEAIIQARLAPDMLPFAYQVKSAAVHSIGAIEGVRVGNFSPDQTTPPDSFVALRERVAAATTALSAIDRSEVDGFVGRDMRFSYGSHAVTYDTEQFLLSFSLPNFYFHVTTAYDILRWQGVAVGKRDYLGAVRSRRQ
jgi:uncharacterized protein